MITMTCEFVGAFPTADELLGVDRSMWQIADELLYANRCKWSSRIVRITGSHSDRKNYNQKRHRVFHFNMPPPFGKAQVVRYFC